LKEQADFALIQFGHNDSHGKGRPEATDPDTDFKANLRTYIDTFRDAGVQPILVTPMHRRTYLNGRLTEELKPYADAIKTVALEKGVPVVDLYTSSGILFETLGEEAGSDLNVSKTDRTHFSEKGARAMADLVLTGLKSISPELGEQIR
jgi:lysophospholipase L1-like esterase